MTSASTCSIETLRRSANRRSPVDRVGAERTERIFDSRNAGRLLVEFDRPTQDHCCRPTDTRAVLRSVVVIRRMQARRSSLGNPSNATSRSEQHCAERLSGEAGLRFRCSVAGTSIPYAGQKRVRSGGSALRAGTGLSGEAAAE